MKLFREQLLLFCHREMHKKSSQQVQFFVRDFLILFWVLIFNLKVAVKKSLLQLLLDFYF